jgi:hypothetical protein
MALAKLGKIKMNTIVAIMNTIATLECSPRRWVKSRKSRGIATTNDSSRRKTVRYVLKVTGVVSIDVVT